MKKMLRHFLAFSARERNGAFILALLIACTTGIKMWLLWQRPVAEKTDFTDLELKLSLYAWQDELTREDVGGWVAMRLPDEDQYAIPAMHDFDPNTVTAIALRSMGLDPKVAQTLINYRNKGGVFSSEADLKKIYGMTTGEFNRLRPFIKIGEKYLHHDLTAVKRLDSTSSRESDLHNDPSVTLKVEGLLRLELNTADSSSLIRLRGIGPVLASRIVKYRALLGGYADTDQLGEVYGITDSLLLTLEDVVFADTSLLKRIEINRATTMQLSRHPYIGRYDAEGIILYREYADSIRSLEELILNGLLPEDKAKKLKSYLLF